MRDRDPTVESLALGAELDTVMKQAGLTRAAMATRLGRTPSYVSRLLAGLRGGQAAAVVQWLDTCDVTGQLRVDILRMRMPCGACGCRCDHTGLLTCCEATEISTLHSRPDHGL